MQTSVSQISKANMSQGGGVTSKRFNWQCHYWHLEADQCPHLIELTDKLDDWKKNFSFLCIRIFLLDKKTPEHNQPISNNVHSQNLNKVKTESGLWANGVRTGIILETDDLGIVTHFCCVIPGGPAGQFKPLFGASSLTTSWHESTTGWEMWRRKQFTPQGSIIRARDDQGPARCITRSFTFKQTTV